MKNDHLSRLFLLAGVLLLGGLITITATPPVHSQDAGGAREAKETRGSNGESKPKEAAPVPVKEKEKIKNNIRRLIQNSRMTRARGLVKNAIKKAGKNPANADLLAFAYWAKAVLEGNAQPDPKTGEDHAKENCLKYFDLAIASGWKNPYAFQYAALIRDDVRSSPEFLERVERLAREFEAQEDARFRKRLEEGLARAGSGSAVALPEELRSLEAVRGRPALLVLAELYHDGFTKAIPVLRAVHDDFKDSVPVVVAFYQYRPVDELTRKLAAGYVRQNALEAPYGFVGREAVKALDVRLFPVFLFVDSEARVVFRQDGLLNKEFMEKFFRTALAKLAATAASDVNGGKEDGAKDRGGKKDAGKKDAGKAPAGDAAGAKPAEKPAPEKPAPEKPAPEKAAPRKPAPEKPAPDKPAPEKPTPEKDGSSGG